MLFNDVQKKLMGWPEVDQHPHFEKTAFRVRKKIFTTWWPNDHVFMIILTPIEQKLYLDAGRGNVYPVKGAWGVKGCTLFAIEHVEKELFWEAMTLSYQRIFDGSKKKK